VRIRLFATAALVGTATLASLTSIASAQRVQVTLDPSLAKGERTGRVFVFFSHSQDREPRLAAGSYGGSVPFFGADVSQWRAGTPAVLDATTLGFPYQSLAELPAGDYYVQATAT